ncbi:MAG: (cytosine-5-)-methyltransferase [Actinoallomurus sp.]|jgi:transposase|nr:(cytosine-5-)-methyltransferase [Actinoallomurus sp.]
MSTNWRMPHSPARYRTTRPRNARFSLAISRTFGKRASTTDLARRFDLIRVEDLKIKNMVGSARGTDQVPGKNVRAKAGLNRSIHAAGWGRLVTRLEQKAPGRVEKVDPA